MKKTTLLLCICLCIVLFLSGCNGNQSAPELSGDLDAIDSQVEAQAAQPVQAESVSEPEDSELESFQDDVPDEPSNTGNTEEASTEQQAVPSQPEPEESTAATSQPAQNDLGALAPDAALAYMQTTDNLVIVDVAAVRWYNEQHFEGALNIPIEELGSDERDALYMAIPSDRPVLLHCRRGVIVPGAYGRVKELRSDIPEIAYIDGVPPFEEYNTWGLQDNKNGGVPCVKYLWKNSPAAWLWLYAAAGNTR